MNWKAVAAKDRRLRDEADNAGEALARHRYENTIAVKVSFSEYARQVGVHQGQVQRYAQAWHLRLETEDMPISDALVRALTSAERYDVIEAVAKAKGTTTKTVQAHHRAEVARVQQAATLRAEERGTTVKEEARRLLDIGQRRSTSDQSRAERRRAQVDLQWLELDAHLDKARLALANAVKVDVELTEEHLELFRYAIKSVKALTKLVEERFVGMTDHDFEAEAAELLSKGA